MALLYVAIFGYLLLSPADEDPLGSPWLEACRQVCAEYGLIPSGDIKADAQEYLQAAQKQQLSESLEAILVHTDVPRAKSEAHPLLGQTAPDFNLSCVAGTPVSLRDLNQNGPVVLVFYYGYGCSHCVAQLFALQEDLHYFRELGATVVAISADAPESTLEKYVEYGAFDFTVLSDPDYSVAEAYSVYRRPTDEQSEDLLHGTFVIDRSGQVIFANRGYQPFIDNPSLLRWIADSETGADRTTLDVAVRATTEDDR
ncbi:MAG: peroxiredoxin family protein [Planctomycetaceae bacterium]